MRRKATSKWSKIPSGRYRIVDLGRPAVFFIPVKKLYLGLPGRTIQEELHDFLVNRYGGYTATTLPSFGVWRGLGDAIINDECCVYEVSILGKNKVKPLLEKLAELAQKMGEECIYVKAGQYSGLVYPPNPKE